MLGRNSMTVSIREMVETDKENWNAFVRAHPDGTFCHLAEWKNVIEDGAGHRCPYLLAEENGQILGVLPLTLRKSALFGHALVSSMFCVYGGALASTVDVYERLDSVAWDLAQHHNIDILEYRTVKADHKDDASWQVMAGNAATFQKPLQSDPEAILLDIPRKQRAVVRKSLKNELHACFEPDLDSFYHLYAVSVRNLGTPVFPKKLFAAMLRHFGKDVEIQIVKTKEGVAIASLMSFYFKDRVLPYYAGGNEHARKYGAHDYMYYQLMIRAVEKGKSFFDFGRSKEGSGPYKFKKNWGFTPTPLEYEVKITPGAAIPDLSPNSAKYRLMVEVWKKLPLPLANLIGPVLARHLG